MITRTNTLSALLVLFSLFGFAMSSRGDDAKSRVKNALQRNQFTDLATAPENEKTAILAELRKQADEDPLFAHRATRALVQLGDAETIQHYVQMFNEGREGREWRRAAKILKLAADPTVIARVAGQLANQESSGDILDGDVLMSPHSVLAAEIIIAVGAKATQMPTSVRAGFHNIQTHSPEEVRAVVRRWWKANQAAFDSGKFDRVAPHDNQTRSHIEG
jgi:hypothetical protein